LKHSLPQLALLLPLLLAAAPVVATPTNVAENCSEWAEARQQSTAEPTIYWLQGFVAAYDLYEYTGKNPKGVMGSAEGDDLATWMDSYCQKNSQSNPQAAIESLIEERKPAQKACPVRRSGGRPCPRAKKEEIPEIGE
jgi:hypothetical protein